jgi:hypothetical protein
MPTTKESGEAIRELRKALFALRLEVAREIADDVTERAERVIALVGERPE